jgi:hypothetical protein
VRIREIIASVEARMDNIAKWEHCLRIAKMKYNVGDIVKATVTKSRPGQSVGLDLEETNRRILVTEVGGLFQENRVPVHTGDQLLEVNGIQVTNKEQFPNGLKDIQVFLKREWNIWVKVKKGSCVDDRDNTAPTVASEASYSERRSTPQNVGSNSEDSSIEESEDEGKETRRAMTTSKPRRKRQPRSKSPFSALAAVEKKRKGRKTRTTRKKASDESDSGSENTGTTQSLSADDNTPPRCEDRTCQTGTLVSIDEDDAVNVSPLMPHKFSKESSDIEIKSIHNSGQGINVELGNGERVSVTPEQLLAAVSDHNMESPTVTPESKLDRLMQNDKPGEQAPYVPDMLSLKNLLEDTSTRVSLSNLLAARINKQDFGEEESSPHSRTASSTKNLIKELRTRPRRKSLPLYLSEPTIQLLLMNAIEKHFTDKRTRSRSQSPPPEESSEDESSTHSCMTNLIDPGDLMKIRGFKSKPELNGATVEAVRKSKDTKGKRWDVRVKHLKHNSNINSKRLVSVATKNLKHFM